MTMTELEKLEALHAAATPGRWSPAVWQGNDDTGGWAAVGPHQESTDCICESEEDRAACKGYSCEDDRSQNDEEQAWEDAKAIAALHNAFPAMAKALRESQAEVERLREVVRKVHTLAEVLLPVWPESRFGGPIREIHRLTKGTEEGD